MKVARPVLNGGDEETGSYRPRFVATQQAGAVRRRRCISRCTDRSARGCADRHTFYGSFGCELLPPATALHQQRTAPARAAPFCCLGRPGPSRHRRGVTSSRVVHKSWGKPVIVVGKVVSPAGVEHPACWGSRGKRAVRWRRKQTRAWACPRQCPGLPDGAEAQHASGWAAGGRRCAVAGLRQR